eukprot:evm.model.scf_1126.2 EVM.evm.TU.scf_1126.2   scf_1126:13729-15130(+)
MGLAIRDGAFPSPRRLARNLSFSDPTRPVGSIWIKGGLREMLAAHVEGEDTRLRSVLHSQAQLKDALHQVLEEVAGMKAATSSLPASKAFGQKLEKLLTRLKAIQQSLGRVQATLDKLEVSM